MDQELIVKALKSACGNKNFKFQVVIEDEQLHIYANHRANYQPNYDLLQENVAMAIASLTLDSLFFIWLYCRPLGKVEPNWQAYVKLPILVNQEDDDTLNITEDLKSEIDFTHSKETLTKNSNNSIDHFILQDDELEEDSAEDTGLLNDTGLIHGAPLKEEEIYNTFAISTIESGNQSENSKSADADLSKDSNNNSFPQYYFVTNKKLLTSDIIFPSKEIIRLIKFFHHLSENNQHKLLPILQRYFLNKETPNLSTMAIAIQKWFKEVGKLNFEDHHLFAIWLSRYCFAPNNTLEEFEKITAASTTAETAKKAKIRSTEYSFTPADANSVSIAPESFVKSDGTWLNKPKFQLPPMVNKVMLPGAWILATVILLMLGIITNNSHTVIASSQIPGICSNNVSANYCRLAVNLVGEKRITQAPKSLFPLTEVTETVATYGCQRYANLKAKISNNIAPEQTPVISSHGEKIFPHIYVITAKQKNEQQSRNTQVGCVYTTGERQRSPELLGADIIPGDWPTEHYQKQAGLKDNLTFGSLTQPINLGLYTIFAALGIAIASWLNLGIKINHSQTIYLLALILGLVQVVVSSISFFGIIEAVILPVVVLSTASLLIKDFQLKWNRGYPLIAMLMMITIQFLFYGLCFGLINGFV